MYLNNGVKKAPPYVSHKSWETFLDRVRSDLLPLPQRLDKTVWRRMNFSGSTESALKGALVFLGLTTPNNYQPTDEFAAFLSIDNDGERRRYLGQIINTAYSNLLEGVELSRATRGEVIQSFRNAGSGQETAEKAVSFFVGLALDAEIPLHTQLSTKPKNSRRRKKSAETKGRGESTGENMRTSNVIAGAENFPGLGNIHPALIGLLEELPSPDEQWSKEGLDAFLKAFEAILHVVYDSSLQELANDHNKDV
jgi:hypothetical protein